MKIDEIKGLVSLKAYLDEGEELTLISSRKSEEELISCVTREVIRFLGPQLVDNVLVWRNEGGIHVIVKIGKGSADLLEPEEGCELMREIACEG